MFHIKIELQYCAERCCMDGRKTIIYNVYTQIDLSVAILLGDLFHNHYIHLSCNWTKYSIQCPNMMENLLIFSSARNHRTTKWETKKSRKINQIQVNQTPNFMTILQTHSKTSKSAWNGLSFLYHNNRVFSWVFTRSYGSHISTDN